MATAGGGRSRRDRRARKRKEKREEKQADERMRNFSLPEEIIEEILKCLPVESLVRFTSVCKPWYALIHSPNFISIHSKQLASTKSLILLRDCPSKKPNTELYSLHLDDETLEKHKILDIPVKILLTGGFFRVVGCVNGVVCLSDDIQTYTEDMILWNPSIRKFILLPLPLFRYSTFGGFDHAVGFGFDDHTNDFKVVRVVYHSVWEARGPPKVEIYEPRAGFWREVDSNGFGHRIDVKSPQVFLHGNVHWVTGCKIDYFEFELPNTKNLVVTFDIRSETFGTMEVPDSLNQHNFRQDFCISALGESLALIHDTATGDGNTCCVWVMKEYGVAESWAKLFSIDVTGGSWRIFGFRRNGEALVKSRGLLFSLDPKSRQATYFSEFENWKALYVDNFVESLALLGDLENTLVHTESSGEDSSELEDVSWRQEPAQPPAYFFERPAQVLIHWFG